MHFCHCHAIDLCFPACFCSGECSIPPVLLQCVWTVFMPSSDPPLTLQTRPDPIRHPLHPTPKRIGLLLCLFSSRLVSSRLFFCFCLIVRFSCPLPHFFYFSSHCLVGLLKCCTALRNWKLTGASSHFMMSFLKQGKLWNLLLVSWTL